MTVIWNDKALLDKVEKENERAAKRGAMIVANDARRRVPVVSGDLKRSIKVKKSKFKGGGYIVLTGGGNAYYWHMVHYGSVRNKERVPYMTKALESNRTRILKEFKNTI